MEYITIKDIKEYNRTLKDHYKTVKFKKIELMHDFSIKILCIFLKVDFNNDVIFKKEVIYNDLKEATTSKNEYFKNDYIISFF